MTRRDLFALLAGACIALAAAAVLLPAGRAVVGQAQAQAPHEPPLERQRQLVFAIGSALASIAVDGERTAVALNQTTDRVAELEARLKHLEKRLAELESKR
jgi:hypothetical protein